MEITAAVAHEPNSDFTIETLHLDGPRAGEVLVEITSVGICHTDVATRDGQIPFQLPAVLGHEGAGTVLEVGAGVTKVAAGDKVGLTFNYCGHCRNCAKGAMAYCDNFLPLNYAGVRLSDGISPMTTRDGKPVSSLFFGQSSFASHALATQFNVVKLSDDADLELVGPLGCGVQTGAGAVMNTLCADEGSTLLVMGGGSVGLAAVLGGVVQGCANIIVVEPHASRRALALEMGATHALAPESGAVSDQVRVIDPRGADFIFDTTGIPAVIESLFTAMAPHARLGLVGMPSDPEATINLSLMGALVAGVTIHGIIEGDSVPDSFIPEMVQLHVDGRFAHDKMITKFPFVQINEALEAQRRGDVVKAVLLH